MKFGLAIKRTAKEDQRTSKAKGLKLPLMRKTWCISWTVPEGQERQALALVELPHLQNRLRHHIQEASLLHSLQSAYLFSRLLDPQAIKQLLRELKAN